jgi:hypothetical protein
VTVPFDPIASVTVSGAWTDVPAAGDAASNTHASTAPPRALVGVRHISPQQYRPLACGVK